MKSQLQFMFPPIRCLSVIWFLILSYRSDLSEKWKIPFESRIHVSIASLYEVTKYFLKRVRSNVSR